MAINMRRDALINIDDSNCEHAGLWLQRGFKEYDENGEKKSKAITQFHKTATNITNNHSRLYEKCYENWQQFHQEKGTNSQIWFGKLINRMYLGMGEASPLEAGITLHHTYGVPFIPGSAIKGVLHHYAQDIGLKDNIQNILFGEGASGKEKIGNAGYIIFNDAWWIPEGKALVPEVITVHTQHYHKNKGKNFLHPDFESPNPNPQIAIQGSFMFSVEGNEQWAKYAIELLAQAMEHKGIGGKVASGYGYFEATKAPLNTEDKKTLKYLEELLSRVKKDNFIKIDKVAYASKPMAEEWVKVEDQKLKQKVLNLLQDQWKQNERMPSKKAQKIYNESNGNND